MGKNLEKIKYISPYTEQKLSNDIINEINFKIMKNLRIKENKFVKIRINITKRTFNALKIQYNINGHLKKNSKFEELIKSKRSYNAVCDWCAFKDLKVKVTNFKDIKFKNENLELISVKKGFCLLSICFIRIDEID